jgi:hypothetical protein
MKINGGDAWESNARAAKSLASVGVRMLCSKRPYRSRGGSLAGS